MPRLILCCRPLHVGTFTYVQYRLVGRIVSKSICARPSGIEGKGPRGDCNLPTPSSKTRQPRLSSAVREVARGHARRRTGRWRFDFSIGGAIF